MRSTDEIVLASIGDLHLTLDPPTFRSDEKNWLECQAKYLGQVKDVVATYSVPLVCTGDIFDDGWREKKCSPELINFVIKHLPTCYAVAGNHDLPHHRVDQIERSAYWTLVEAGVVKHLHQPFPHETQNGLHLWGASWGEEIKKPKSSKYDNILVCHKYVWNEGAAFPGVPKEDHWSYVPLAGYTAATFGDNHRPFLINDNFAGCSFLNGGTFMRRRADEIDVNPFVGLLTKDGIWRKHYIDVSADKYLVKQEGQTASAKADYADLFKMLNELGEASLDYIETVKLIMKKHKADESVRDIISKVLGEL